MNDPLLALVMGVWSVVLFLMGWRLGHRAACHEARGDAAELGWKQERNGVAKTKRRMGQLSWLRPNRFGEGAQQELLRIEAEKPEPKIRILS